MVVVEGRQDIERNIHVGGKEKDKQLAEKSIVIVDNVDINNKIKKIYCIIPNDISMYVYVQSYLRCTTTFSLI